MVLDTHVWIWLVTGSQPLPDSIVEAAKENSQAIAISATSIWEAHLLLERGRITPVASPEQTIRSWLGAYPFPVIPIGMEIAMLSRTLRFQHEDPADRFIASTAFQLGVPLATLDARLGSLDWLQVIPAS